MHGSRFVFALLSFASIASAQQPCCSILTVDADSGWVTAKVTASNKPFLFKARDKTILATLSAGDAIQADFETKVVSLDGNEVAGDIMGIALPESAVPLTPMSHPTHVPPVLGGPGKWPCGAAEVVNAVGPIGPSSTTPLGALAAVNELQRISWTNFSAQMECDVFSEIMAINSNLPDDDKEIGLGIHYHQAMNLSDVSAHADLRSPPGLRYACLEQSDCPANTPPGFGVDVPVDSAGWSIHASATLNTHIDVYQELEAYGYDKRLATYVSCCKSETIDVTLSKIRITTSAEFLTPVDLSRPMLNAACVTVHATIELKGAISTNGPQELLLTASVPFQGPINLTNAHPIAVTVALREFNSEPLTAHLDDFNVTFAASEGASFTLGGTLKVIAFRFRGEDYGPAFGFHQTVHLSLPEGIVQALAAGLPRTWGENPPSQFWTQRANPALDFAGQATVIESAIVPHLQSGLVLSIDHSNSGPVAHPHAAPATGPHGEIPIPLGNRLFDYQCPATISPFAPAAGVHPIPVAPKCYRQEFDSAIHTGEYLTAEAFRYAATHSHQALDRIKLLLGATGEGGIARLFWVTEDAAVSMRGRTVAVGDKGVLSRTAFPSTSPLPLGDSSTGKIAGLGKCYYVRPEGGWDVQYQNHKRHFASFSDIPLDARKLIGNPFLKGLKVTPVGKTWYGLGCGEGDENPISRDQYLGIFMGLAYAHALVPDATVQSTTKDLLTKALAFLIKNNWDVRVPPYRRIPMDSTFLRSWEDQLAFLRIGASVNPDAVMENGVTLNQLYQTYAAGSKLSWIPTWFTMIEPIVGGGFAANLTHAAVGPTLLLETDPELHKNYMLWYNMLRRETQFHKNAYFNALAMFVGGLTPSQPSSPSNPTLMLGEEFTGILAEWLTRRDAVNAGNGLPYNFVGIPQYQRDVFDTSGAVLYTTVMGDQRYVSRYALPVYARNGDGLDFVWQRNPFNMAVKIPPKNPPPDPVAVAEAQQRARDKLSALLGIPLPPVPIPDEPVDCSAVLPVFCEGSTNATSAGQVYDCGSDHANQEAPGVDYLLAYWMGVYLHILPPPA